MAAPTSDHKLDGLNNRKEFSQTSRGQKSDIS